MKRRLIRFLAYFRRGHNIYLAFILSFANFVVIQYRLLVEHVSFLREVFTSLAVFALFFMLTYVPIAVLLGWLDYRKICVPVETELTSRANPWVRDLARALYLIADGKSEEAKRVLERWLR